MFGVPIHRNYAKNLLVYLLCMGECILSTDKLIKKVLVADKGTGRHLWQREINFLIIWHVRTKHGRLFCFIVHFMLEKLITPKHGVGVFDVYFLFSANFVHGLLIVSKSNHLLVNWRKKYLQINCVRLPVINLKS